MILKLHLEQRSQEFIRDFLSGDQVTGDLNCMLVDRPTAAIAARGHEEHSRSQAALYPCVSRVIAVSARERALEPTER